MIRDRCSVERDPECSIPGTVCAEHCPRATAHGPLGAFEDAPGHEHWGLYWDWLERDPDSGERNAPSNGKSGNLSGNFSDPAQNFCFLEKEKSLQNIVL